MRLARFAGRRLCVARGDLWQDVTDWAFAHSPRRTDDPLIAFIEARARVPVPVGRTAAAPSTPEAPIRKPGKIIAAAANYWKHTQEMNPGQTNLGGIREKGFFLKAPTSIIGPGESIRLPFADRRTDHEAELAIVIGKTGSRIPADRVASHIFGYTCLLDITLRGKEDRGLRKSFDTFTPIGPSIVTADEVGDPNALAIECRVNGEPRQSDTTASMIMPVPELVAWISQVMTLEAGDLIATGTPAGVAPLQPGDAIEVTIEKLGTLGVGVAAGWDA